MNSLSKDYIRYGDQKSKLPSFQKYYRKYQTARFGPLKFFYKILFVRSRDKNLIDMSIDTKIGEGLYVGHPYCITINPKAVIGCNCNIHKGVTIGRENRGERKGAPVIGNYVWIGIGAVIVGNVHIGSDVLIAPNSFVNCDVPDHSIVIGNPCRIIHRDNATDEYIKNTVETGDE